MSKPAFLQRYPTALVNVAENRLTVFAWWALAVVTYVLARVAQTWLDANYAASEFPVPFYTGQTTFNAEELKGYYQVLLDKGTLTQFVRTQIIDYVFMLATFFSFFCASAALLRSLGAVQAPRFVLAIGRFFVWFAPLAAVMDTIENGFSFITLLNPTDFASWLVYPYSSFAVAKFAIFTLTYLWAIVSVLIIVLVGTRLAYKHLTKEKAAQ